MKAFGVRNGSSRTPVQTEIGRFSVTDRARLLAVLHITAADAIIAVFDYQVLLQLLAAGDGDPRRRHRRDQTGCRVVAARPDTQPSRVSGCSWRRQHCLRRGAAALLFGTKKVTITLSSTVSATTHTFHSTDEIIKEIIAARIYGGMHYRTSGVHGSVMGRKVVHWIDKHYFQPVAQ